jgi:hypothetical protein
MNPLYNAKMFPGSELTVTKEEIRFTTLWGYSSLVIPIKQVASFQGSGRVIFIETTGGKKHMLSVPGKYKNAFKEALSEAMN